ncbi:unnamed protein product [Ambrosiozyma monospora]|uniref:4a-hydroxytetrahydrobiopterin dehydratase n=1 Tax=Ambrosiozyma monospora TaxID=43982 RepID=A0A9W6YT88_AMBMO|nr:unnamed protein product [Ambrosiozyma monospora]
MSKQATKYIKLTLPQIQSKLQTLPIKWQLNSVNTPTSKPISISTTFKFKTFEDTWAYLTKISMRSHLAGHHPTITTTYNEVKLVLSTHDVDGVSEVDFKLAKRFSDYVLLVPGAKFDKLEHEVTKDT